MCLWFCVLFLFCSVLFGCVLLVRLFVHCLLACVLVCWFACLCVSLFVYVCCSFDLYRVSYLIYFVWSCLLSACRFVWHVCMSVVLPLLHSWVLYVCVVSVLMHIVLYSFMYVALLFLLSLCIDIFISGFMCVCHVFVIACFALYVLPCFFSELCCIVY